MTNWAQRSMAAGELAPALHSRADLARHAIGLRRFRNFRGLREGGGENRPGTVFVNETRYPAKHAVLRPFVKNASIGDSYQLEFGDLYLEFVRAGARVTETAKNITAITQANPAQITIVGHGYSVNDDLLLAGIVGMIPLNGRRVRVLSTPTADTFTIGYVDGTNVNSTGFPAYVSGGTAARVYKLGTPYTEAQVDRLQYDTQNDVAILVHRSHKPRKLTRIAHANWTLAEVSFNPGIDFSPAVTASGTAGGTTQRYKVTSISAEGIESLSGWGGAAIALSTIAQASNPAVTTSAPHGLLTGDEIEFDVMVGMAELEGRRFIIEVTGASAFKILNVDTTTYGAFTSGNCYPTAHRIASITAPAIGTPITVSWTAPSSGGAVKYAIYREVAGEFGFIGFSTGLSFPDTGYTAAAGDTPPSYSDRFRESGDYPGTVAFHQGRAAYGSTDRDPVDAIHSRTGDYFNLTAHDPPIDSDSIHYAAAVRGATQLRHLVPNRRLTALCDGALVVVEGDREGIVTPLAQNPNPYSQEGASFVRPVVVSGRVIFPQARGSVLLDFGYDIEQDYSVEELSNSAGHLFDRYAIRDMAAQLAPHPTIWMVRSDGKLVGLTYVRAEQMRSFHWHDTDGEFESVSVVPELAVGIGDDDIDEEDAAYFIVARTVNGATRRYVERLHSRRYTDLRDAVFLDCAKTYDGRNTTATQAKLSGGVNWTSDETLVLTFTVSQTALVVNDVVQMTGADGLTARARILSGAGAVYSVRCAETVPASLRNTFTAVWAHAKFSFTGLFHLEAKSVAVLGDGNVFASPNRGTGLTVSSGTVTLPNDADGNPQTAAVVQVGLPYRSELETLNPETPEGMSMAGKQKIVKTVLVHVFESRGFHVGPEEPPAATPTKNMEDVKLDPATVPNQVPAVVTKIHRVPILGKWAEHGRVFLSELDPLPLTVLAITSEGEIGR